MSSIISKETEVFNVPAPLWIISLPRKSLIVLETESKIVRREKAGEIKMEYHGKIR